MQVLIFCELGLKTPIHVPKFFWGKIGEGVVRYWPPTNSFLLLWVFTSAPVLVKIDQEMRSWQCGQTDGHTHWQTNWIYNLSHAIRYSYGADNYVEIASKAASLQNRQDIYTSNVSKFTGIPSLHRSGKSWHATVNFWCALICQISRWSLPAPCRPCRTSNCKLDQILNFRGSDIHLHSPSWWSWREKWTHGVLIHSKFRLQLWIASLLMSKNTLSGLFSNPASCGSVAEWHIGAYTKWNARAPMIAPLHISRCFLLSVSAL